MRMSESNSYDSSSNDASLSVPSDVRKQIRTAVGNLAGHNLQVEDRTAVVTMGSPLDPAAKGRG